MTIAPGATLPEATFVTMTAEGPLPMTTNDVFAGRKVVLFAVPGAFTPTCHNEHLPGFLSNAEAIKQKGVDTIACIAVNDVFVMDAWAKASGIGSEILMLADGNGDFAKATGLDLDGSGLGMGVRSRRYAMIVDDGTMTALNIEETPGTADASGAAAILSLL